MYYFCSGKFIVMKNSFPVQTVYHLLVKDPNFGWTLVSTWQSLDDAKVSCLKYKNKLPCRIDMVSYTNIYIQMS